MAVFESKKRDHVETCGGTTVIFKGGKYETKNEDIISCLESKGFKRVDNSKRDKSKVSSD